MQAVVGGLALVAALAVAVYSLITHRHDLVRGVHQLSVVDLMLAVAGVAGLLLASMLTWRALVAAGGDRLSVVAACRVFFVSAIGKYLPGALWPYLAQVQLGARYGVAKASLALTGLLQIVVTLVTGFAVAALLLPIALPPVHRQAPWLVVAAPVILFLLHPRLLALALALAARVLRRPVPPVPSAAGIAAAAGWSGANWLSSGLMIFALDRSMGGGGGRGFLLAVGGWALAWCVGFVVVIAPAGAGVREAVLVFTLAPVLDHDRALVVALLSRLLNTVGDLVAALLSAAGPLRRSLRATRSGRPLLPVNGAEDDRAAERRGADAVG